jgi:hypothetical protein
MMMQGKTYSSFEAVEADFLAGTLKACIRARPHTQDMLSTP